MTKNVSVSLICALASMAGNKHPIPIAIVDRPRIAFNIFYSLQGREFARKKDPDAVCEGSAESRFAFAQLLERPRKERLQALARMPKDARRMVELLVHRRDRLYLYLRPHGRLR